MSDSPTSNAGPGDRSKLVEAVRRAINGVGAATLGVIQGWGGRVRGAITATAPCAAQRGEPYSEGKLVGGRGSRLCLLSGWLRMSGSI